MAAKEMYDYLDTVAPDVDVTLGAGDYAIHPEFSVPELGVKNQIIHLGDDGSEEVIDLTDSVYFTTSFSWRSLTEAQSGSLFDLFYDSAKANCMASSIKWTHPTDGHIYVIKFRSFMQRDPVAAGVYDIAGLKVKIIGKIADV